MGRQHRFTASRCLIASIGDALLLGISLSTTAYSQGASANVSDSELQERFQLPLDDPTPFESATWQDLVWNPLRCPLYAELGHWLQVQYVRGQLQLVRPETQKAVWSGPFTSASFTQETTAGVHVIRDATNQEVWTDAAEGQHPDLVLSFEGEGQAHLRDRTGKTLWSGSFGQTGPVTKSWHAGGSNSKNMYKMEFNDVNIAGTAGGATTLRYKNGPVLWSGTLPKEPTLLIRQQDRFMFRSTDRLETGADQVCHISFEGSVGSVTASDALGRILGTRPVEILKMTVQVNRSGATTHPPRITTLIPTASLKTKGTVFLTYRDSAGNVINRSKPSYKDKRFTAMIGAKTAAL